MGLLRNKCRPITTRPDAWQQACGRDRGSPLSDRASYRAPDTSFWALAGGLSWYRLRPDQLCGTGSKPLHHSYKATPSVPVAMNETSLSS